MRQLNYGLVDWFVQPPRYGLNLARAFAPTEFPQTYYFPPSPYPIDIPYTRDQEFDTTVALAATPNRVTF